MWEDGEKLLLGNIWVVVDMRGRGVGGGPCWKKVRWCFQWFQASHIALLARTVHLQSESAAALGTESFFSLLVWIFSSIACLTTVTRGASVTTAVSRDAFHPGLNRLIKFEIWGLNPFSKSLKDCPVSLRLRGYFIDTKHSWVMINTVMRQYLLDIY